jgi:Ankyrin repeats (3 copies)/Ankyrin repeat
MDKENNINNMDDLVPTSPTTTNISPPTTRASSRGGGGNGGAGIVDVNFIGNTGGMTCLHISAKEGHADCVEFLLSRGANIFATDNALWSALHHAAAAGKTSVVQVLLDHLDAAAATSSPNCIVNAKSKNGSTPLSLAISNAKLDVAYLLLDHGALLHESEECINNKGKTPLDMAPTPEMRQALVAYSKRNNNKVNNVVVMHQIEKLLANVKMGRTTLNYGSHDSNSACAAVILHQRAGKRRPRPRW